LGDIKSHNNSVKIILGVSLIINNIYMRGFFVKVEKIKSLLERDGFWAGWINILDRLLRVVKKMIIFSKGDVVFVSGLAGDPAMYRTECVAEELRAREFKTTTLYKDDIFLVYKLKKFKIIVLHRVIVNERIKKILKQAKKINQTIIYDTDDLDFDAKIFRKTNMYQNLSRAQKEEHKKGVGLEILQNKQLKAITTPTSFLAEKLKKFKKPVFIVKNKLSKQELKWTREGRKKYLDRTKNDKHVKIGYFSGSISHNRDFDKIIPALEIILNRYSNVKLCLVGYLDVNNKFYRKFRNQIIQLPFVPRKQHYQNIAEIDINLAPLEMNDFCQAKSELKFFETGIIGVPTIATRNQTFSEAIEDGRSGLLAANHDEWVRNLERLIDDKELRITLGEKARQVVLKKYLTSSGDNFEYYKFLEKIIDED